MKYSINISNSIYSFCLYSFCLKRYLLIFSTYRPKKAMNSDLAHCSRRCTHRERNKRTAANKTCLINRTGHKENTTI